MRFSTILALATSLLASTTTTVLAATTCNGYSSLCSKLYSGVAFIGAHNSYAVGSSLVHNQGQDVTTQLKDGIRTLQVQAHTLNGTIHVCHQSCSLQDSGTLQAYLSTVSSWVASNPNEVLSIVIVNFNNLPATQFSAAFDAAGLSQYAYSPPSAQIALSAWPTLGSMIDNGKRVVVFMDNQANYDAVPWIIDEFSNMFEDAYDVTDQSFGCASNRTSGNPGSQLMLVNHFLDNVYTLAGMTFFIPNTAKLNETNAQSGYGSVGTHVENCRSIWGRAPNHILLDFYNSNGLSPFLVAASLNGVAAPTNTVASAKPSLATSTSAGSPTGGSGTVKSSTSGSTSGADLRISLGLGSGLGLGVVALLGGVLGVVTL